MTAAVAISAVHKRFGRVRALEGIDLTIGRGEFFGLLGPNGAGKSTLINIIAGLTRADAGTVAVLGHDVVNEYRPARQALGIVPQELVFDPFFTVREVLQIQSGYFGLGAANEAWLDELLQALMLSDKASANMRTLSGGMKRRVLVAQALVHKPEVVVLDEPTAGVDVELRKSLWEFIQRLHRHGHTIVLTTHYLEEAEALCDRIGILNHGALVALDTTQGLMEQGIGNTLCVCITTAEPVTALPSALEAKLKERDATRLVFQLNKDSDSIIEVLDSLRTAGVAIVDLQTVEADLEDVFIELTRTRSEVAGH